MSKPYKTPLRVLIVEDSQLTAEQIREILEQIPTPTDIKITGSQDDAIAAADEFLPEVVVLDLQLSQGNGFGVLKALSIKSPKPKFVVVTNYALPSYRNYAFLIGADFFLDKVKDIDMLKSSVESITRDRNSSQSNN